MVVAGVGADISLLAALFGPMLIHARDMVAIATTVDDGLGGGQRGGRLGRVGF